MNNRVYEKTTIAKAGIKSGIFTNTDNRKLLGKRMDRSQQIYAQRLVEI